MKIQRASLDWALAHVTRYGDTDVFSLPFEYAAIAQDWDTVRCYLGRQDLDTWGVREYRRMLTPKGDLGFRIATQLDPLDTLLICALIYEIGDQFEAVRLPTSEQRVYSHRFLPTPSGQLYDPTVNYEAFRKRSLQMANEPTTAFVLMTDIADFFPRLYTHPMENAMRAATSSSDHARIIEKLVRAWNMGVSYGVPVGPSPFRLISELTISDVDQALLSEDIEFCRYSDDYRIFASDERAARQSLAFLANTLFQNHGLTLQGSKTELVTSEQFIGRFSRTERDQERHDLQESFSDIVMELGIDSRYQAIDYDDLGEELQEIVDSLNLWAIVNREAEAERNLDVPMIRFVLDRIRQLGLIDENDLLVPNLRRFSPVFRDVIEALIAQKGLSDDQVVTLGGRLLDLFDHASVGYLEYHREWLLGAFVDDASWNHSDRLVRLYQTYFDSPTQRAITLALGQTNTSHWFKARKHEVFNLSNWNRRAFLYAASCLPGDEAKHWYGSLAYRLDVLEQAVVQFARKFPLTP